MVAVASDFRQLAMMAAGVDPHRELIMGVTPGTVGNTMQPVLVTKLSSCRCMPILWVTD